MIQLDGNDVVRWLSTASPDELRLLVNGEFSNDDDVWTIIDAGAATLMVLKEGLTKPAARPHAFFRDGTFFLNKAAGLPISQSLENSMSVTDRKIADARRFLSAHGFLVSELGGDTVALFLTGVIRDFEDSGVAPNMDQWTRIHEVLCNAPASTMRNGARYVAMWIERAEKARGLVDLRRRVLLAVLYRHSGQIDKALEASEVVAFPKERLFGGEGSIAILCTTRAATLMDQAETQRAQKEDLLRQARGLLNRANAITGGDSEQIMLAYRRLKDLDKQLLLNSTAG